MPVGARYPADAYLWTPMVLERENRGMFFRQVIGRLRQGVPRRQAEAEMKTIAARLSDLADGNNTSARIIALGFIERLT